MGTWYRVPRYRVLIVPVIFIVLMGAHPIYHNVRKYKNWLIPILISKKYLHIWTQKAVIPGICLVPGMDHFVMRSKKLGKASASGELTIYAPPENETYSSHLISAASGWGWGGYERCPCASAMLLVTSTADRTCAPMPSTIAEPLYGTAHGWDRSASKQAF